jgi:hypothetical protein
MSFYLVASVAALGGLFGYHTRVMIAVSGGARPQQVMVMGLLFNYNTMSGSLGKVQTEEGEFGIPFSNGAVGIQTQEMTLKATATSKSIAAWTSDRSQIRMVGTVVGS